ncbi:MAG: zinc transport system permease protein [Actinomycetota bacterium]|jgi:zinc transport system permease protein|nr:zinc transport system permease protein [Actinomycetota bacterium]
MPWPFDRQFMQLALAAGLVVGLCAPLIGTFLVQKRLSLLGDGIGHVAFAGVAGGVFLGIWPVWSALVVAVGAALGIERLRSRGKAPGDLALALFFYSGLAAGVVLLSLAHGLDANLFGYLFGSILTVAPGDVVLVVVIGAFVVGVIALLGRALFGVVLDEEAARVAGLPVDGLNALLATMAAVVVVASMRVVGVLLVAALMVLPVATAQLVARSFASSLRWAAAVGMSSVVVGLAAARVWNLAPGGTIVLVTAAIFAVASLTAGRRRRIEIADVAPGVDAGEG